MEGPSSRWLEMNNYKDRREVKKLIRKELGDPNNPCTQDPLNTKVLKESIYPRRVKGKKETSLEFDQAYALGAFLADLERKKIYPDLDEKVEEIYKRRGLAVATALYSAGMTSREIAGVCAGVMDHDILTPLNPKPDVFGNCGMGGDRVSTPNISTISMITIAGFEGITVSKHGSPGNTSKAGSSDFFKYLLRKEEKELMEKVSNKQGLLTKIPRRTMEEVIDETGLGYTEALDTKFKTIHRATHKLGLISHMNDVLGPVTKPVNPDKVKTRMVGTNHLFDPKTLAQAYVVMNKRGITNVERGLFVRGEGEYSVDEVSNLGKTKVAELNNGEIEEYSVSPRDFGLEKPNIEVRKKEKGRYYVRGISPLRDKLEASERLMRGQGPQAAKDMVKMNIAAELVVNDVASDLKEGTEVAKNLLDERRGQKVIKRFTETLEDKLVG